MTLQREEQDASGSEEDGLDSRKPSLLGKTSEVEMQSNRQRQNGKQVYTLESEDDDEGLDVRWSDHRHASVPLLITLLYWLITSLNSALQASFRWEVEPPQACQSF